VPGGDHHGTFFNMQPGYVLGVGTQIGVELLHG